MAEIKLPAAILAAGRMSPGLRRATGASCKALIRVGGRLIIDRMLDAMRRCELVKEVRVVCAPGSELLEHVGELGVAAVGPSFFDSVRTGLEALGRPAKILCLTGDLPLLTPEAVDDFCSEGLQSGAAIVYAVITKEVCEAAFPGGRRLYVPLREGQMTGGNVALVNRDFIDLQGDRINRAFAARKNPFRLAAMFGPGFVLRLVAGRLAIKDIMFRAEEMLGATVGVVVSPHASLGFDVDNVGNLEAAEAWLARTEGC